MLGDWVSILMLFGLATLFGVASILIASFVGPRHPTPQKDAPYESGMIPERLPREKFSIKFYLIAMLFIIFDVEIIFFYPFAVIFRELGLFGLAEMGVFIAFLLVAYLYIWRGGGLEWEQEEASLLRRARPGSAELERVG
ncbi:MAG: NADH-quinone oxidoreductase subunit A [Actinomycetota bacterium]